MTYTHITTDELVFIEGYFHHGTPVSQIAKRLGRARQTIHNVITHFKAGHTVIEYYQRYKENKKRCGRKRTVLPEAQQFHVQEKVAAGWTPDVVKGNIKL
jgi:IS30 family transposase